jgi:hypothetical protein
MAGRSERDVNALAVRWWSAILRNLEDNYGMVKLPLPLLKSKEK